MLRRLRAAAGAQLLIAAAAACLLALLFFRLKRFGNLEIHVIETIEVAFAAGIIYFLALYSLEHTADRRAVVWLILAAAVLFRLMLLPLRPTLSGDLFRYRWDGRVQQAGWNPYAAAPDDPRLRSLHDPGDPIFPGHEIPTIYPPLAEDIFRLDYRFFPQPVRFKLLIFAADLLTLFVLAGWLRRSKARNFQLAIYAWNPLVIVEFAGSGHSDALALAVLVSAFAIIRWQRTVSTILLAAAALIKSFPILLFPRWLFGGGWPRQIRAWLDGAAAAALVAVVFWPFRSALGQMPATMAYFESRWRNNNASLYALLLWFSHSPEFAAGIGVGVVAGLAFWTAFRRVELLRSAYLILGAVLLFSPNAYSWYFTWMIPFLCFIPNPAWLLLTILQFLSYHVLIDYQILGIWHFDPHMVALTYAGFDAMLLWLSLRKRRPRCA